MAGPAGQLDRRILAPGETTLELHDLAVAKLAAGREKDKAFVAALIRSGLLDVGVIQARVLLLPEETDPRIGQRIAAWLNYYGAGNHSS